jgi:tRNA G18 (ribose-2'-O)-methylase SpoU
MIAILHNIRSLHNVGSMLRTADSAGIAKLYLCGITPSPLDRFKVVRSDVAKTALGAEKTVAFENVKSTSRLIDKLKKDGYTILAVELDKRAVPYYEYARNPSPAKAGTPFMKGRIALILGAEVEGIPKTILAKADSIIDIPMSGKKESLNVSVAFGVVAFALRDLNK